MISPPRYFGLTEDQAEARLAQFGLNVVHETRRRTFAQVLSSTLREPMFLLLLGAASLYLLVGDLAEGLFLTAGALLSFGLVIVQEARSERALEALNALAEPIARVIRGGKQRSIPASRLVPGDAIVVGEGNRVPADAILFEGDALEVDESNLTGESSPCVKRPDGAHVGSEELSAPGEEQSPSLFASTLVVRGQGIARVVRTGSTTHVGRIGAELAHIVELPTLVQRDIRRLISIIGVLALAFCLVVAAVYGLIRDDWFGGALAGLTLAISLIPEEFPMVLTIFMALGALRLAMHNVLVRRSAVIETLGATTLLCVDKTGTLTENRMTLRKLWRAGKQHEFPSEVPREMQPLIAAAQLASAVRPHDPMDMAVNEVAGDAPNLSLLRSYPLRPDFLAFVQVWRGPDNIFIYAAKGAHETVLRLCPTKDRAEALPAAHAFGEHGMRVLAVASAHFSEDPGCDPSELRFELEGLLAFVDPVRTDVPQALEEARAAGVSVAMITGDFPATALATADIAGVSTKGGVIAGSELAQMTQMPADARIFARIMPDQKLMLVNRFKSAGHVVAMTGDGINDAPAIAAADVGIAMGRRGTDVAREAADLILLDDRFASIIRGIALGRRIFVNLRRALTYITAVHIPVAGLALLPLLLGLPPMLFPMHLVLLELLIDPLCALVFESEPSEAEAMRRPPRSRGERLFGVRQLILAGIQGAVLLAVVLGLYAWLHSAGLEDEMARSAAFIALVVGHLSLALGEVASTGARLFDKRRIAFWLIAAGASTILVCAVTVPMLLDILRFATPTPGIAMISVLAGLAAGGWYAPLRGMLSGVGSQTRTA